MENKHIDFLKEYAKCGIVHNYMHNECDLDERLKIMNEAVAYFSTLQSEIDQLKNELKFSEDRADKRLDAYAKMADVATELQSEIDRLKGEKNQLIEAVENVSYLLYDARNIHYVKDLYSLITRIK